MRLAGETHRCEFLTYIHLYLGRRVGSQAAKGMLEGLRSPFPPGRAEEAPEDAPVVNGDIIVGGRKGGHRGF